MGTRNLRKRKADATMRPQPNKKALKNPKSEAAGVDVLPHNLGPVFNSQQLPEMKKEDMIKIEDGLQGLHAPESISPLHEATENTAQPQRILRSRRSVARPLYTEPEDEFSDEKSRFKKSPKKSRSKRETIKSDSHQDVEAESKLPHKSPRKSKANPYGLTPGITPFPDWEAPSAQDCEDVYALLAKIHGQAKAPNKIPAPSLEVSGCGEVPSVLDAMVRTRLSAHTSSSNSSAAFRGLVDKFGTVKEGIGKGSVDWDKVRLAPVGDIVQAIKCGGLAQIKGKDIKNILEMVHQENKVRRDAFLAEKETGKPASVIGAQAKTQGQKDLEIMKTQENVLSLDHIHGMLPDEAMQELIKFPGIGVKTASCVILFCLQQPSFAVDTHVHRLSGWLKWIPPKATRDEAFSHLEVRIPNHLKYGLHKLFVQHGRSCIRCRANTTKGTEEWNDAECPLEDVIDRVGKRQKAGSGSSRKKVKEEED